MSKRQTVSIGDVFTNLTVRSIVEITKRGCQIVSCDCICGNSINLRANVLIIGHSKSCGCLRVSHVKETARKNRKHGKSKTKTWTTWTEVKQRCNNPNSSSYKKYGGKGIKLADSWHDFGNFLKDMGEKPEPGYELDRIDGTRGYEPGNCRWVTRKQNSDNRSSSKIFEICGERRTLADWHRIFNISTTTYYNRLKKGIDPVDALTSKSAVGFEAKKRKIDKRTNDEILEIINKYKESQKILNFTIGNRSLDSIYMELLTYKDKNYYINCNPPITLTFEIK